MTAEIVNPKKHFTKCFSVDAFMDRPQRATSWDQLGNSARILRLLDCFETERLNCCNGGAEMWRIIINGIPHRLKQEPRVDSYFFELGALFRLRSDFLASQQNTAHITNFSNIGFPFLTDFDCPGQALLMREVPGITIDHFFHPSTSPKIRYDIGAQLIERIRKNAESDILHNDTWHNNILYDAEQGVLSMTDFGSCALNVGDDKFLQGHKKNRSLEGPARAYRPPETTQSQIIERQPAEKYVVAANIYALAWGEQQLQEAVLNGGTFYVNPTLLQEKTKLLGDYCQTQAELLEAVITNLNPNPENRTVTLDEMSDLLGSCLLTEF